MGNLGESIYSTFDLGFHLELSTRPKKSIGSDDEWERATAGLTAALDRYGRDYRVNPGDGAFYGPKIDIHIKDAIGRTWQCGTIQLDMSLPRRFNLSYVGKDNNNHQPIMIHRVIFGSIERFFGILVEHYAGRFPLWLSPVQVVVLPMNDELVPYAREVLQPLVKAGLRVELDDRTESLNKKERLQNVFEGRPVDRLPLSFWRHFYVEETSAETLARRLLDWHCRFEFDFLKINPRAQYHA